MVATRTTICCDCNYLSYERACDIANQALAVGGNGTIHIVLHLAMETTTAALSRLIALRCNLRRSGRDLRIAGLCGQAKDLYEFNRMATLLPCVSHPAEAPAR